MSTKEMGKKLLSTIAVNIYRKKMSWPCWEHPLKKSHHASPTAFFSFNIDRPHTVFVENKYLSLIRLPLSDTLNGNPGDPVSNETCPLRPVSLSVAETTPTRVPSNASSAILVLNVFIAGKLSFWSMTEIWSSVVVERSGIPWSDALMISVYSMNCS